MLAKLICPLLLYFPTLIESKDLSPDIWTHWFDWGFKVLSRFKGLIIPFLTNFSILHLLKAPENQKGKISQKWIKSFKSILWGTEKNCAIKSTYNQVQNILGIYFVPLKILTWRESQTLLFGYFPQDNRKVEFLAGGLGTCLQLSVFHVL